MSTHYAAGIQQLSLVCQRALFTLRRWLEHELIDRLAQISASSTIRATVIPYSRSISPQRRPQTVPFSETAVPCFGIGYLRYVRRYLGLAEAYLRYVRRYCEETRVSGVPKPPFSASDTRDTKELTPHITQIDLRGLPLTPHTRQIADHT